VSCKGEGARKGRAGQSEARRSGGVKTKALKGRKKREKGKKGVGKTKTDKMQAEERNIYR
jgi:hypothetical protein